MKNFEQKKRYNALSIFLLLVIINLIWFGLLVFNRVNFANDNIIYNSAQLGIFMLYFFGLLVCIVLSGFELRLIDINMHRILNIEGKVDYFLRLSTFGIALLVAYLGLSVNFQIIALICEFIILCTFEFIITYISNNDKVFVIDWLNKFIKLKNKDEYMYTKPDERGIKHNILIACYFTSLAVLVFFAIGLIELPISLIIFILAIYSLNVLLVILFFYNKCFKNKILFILSGVSTIVVLGLSYFISIYVFNISFVFLFIFSIICIPFVQIMFRKVPTSTKTR